MVSKDLKNALLELKKLLEKWRLGVNDWTLHVHYCEVLRGHKISYTKLVKKKKLIKIF